MKHLLKKTILQGGGKKKPKTKPAVLSPPKLGQYEILNSYSVAEIIDLLSDGPIEGLVNQNGQSLSVGKSILQGVYLDNTPIEQTSSVNATLDSDTISEYQISSLLNTFGDIYYDRSSNKYKTDYHNPAVSEQ
jgi:hypothetical protein